MRKTAILCALAACALAFAAADGAASEPATLVVDRDGVQCGNAGYASIQAAVDAAQPGDLIRVCPDLYTESVVVDKPLTLKADPDAVEAIDCLQPTLGDLPADQQAIVDPAGAGFSIAFKLEADDVELAGFVVQGASVGIDASDRFSGYSVHHNLIRLNTLFGMDFGSEGMHESRVDHNCFRDAAQSDFGFASWGLVSELDDDSLWKLSDGPERDEWNARDLRNARIDHNSTFRNQAGLEAAGPGVRVLVTFEHNVSREDGGGILLQNATESAILDNEIIGAGRNAIAIGGANEQLVIRGNRAAGMGLAGIRFLDVGLIDLFPFPSRDVLVTNNYLTAGGSGIFSETTRPSPTEIHTLTDSLIYANTTSNNRNQGIVINRGDIENLVRANVADNNGAAGITAALGATDNQIEQNSMHGNVLADARDLNPLLNGILQNDWIGNDCLTDMPAGMICGVG
jgi:nitrous oxidase accessory protein NosD